MTKAERRAAEARADAENAVLALKLDVMAGILRDFHKYHKGDAAWLADNYEANGITEDVQEAYELQYEFNREQREDQEQI